MFSADELAEIARNTKLAVMRAKLTKSIDNDKSRNDWLRTYERSHGKKYYEPEAIAETGGMIDAKRAASRARSARNKAEKAARQEALERMNALPPHPASVRQK